MPCIPPEWLTSPVRTLMRTCNRITHPLTRTDALEGRGRLLRLMALGRDLLHVLIIDIPTVAANNRAIALRAIEPDPECDCDYEANH